MEKDFIDSAGFVRIHKNLLPRGYSLKSSCLIDYIFKKINKEYNLIKNYFINKKDLELKILKESN